MEATYFCRAAHNTRSGVTGGATPAGETVAIKICTGVCGVAGMLLRLPTVVLASISKPTADEREACIEDTLSLCFAAIPNKARIASCLVSMPFQFSSLVPK